MRPYLPLVPVLAGITTAICLVACGTNDSNPPPDTPANTTFDISKINHVVVIYQENWSFDGLYSQFPGANGIAFGTAVTQHMIGSSTAAISAVPSPLNGGLDTVNFPTWPASQPTLFSNLSAAPYNLQPNALTGDIVHRFYINQWQINGGANDGYMAWSDNPGLVLSGFDATSLPEGKLAQQYTMCDNAYQSAFGGSFLNHIFLISAAAPVYGPSGTYPLNGASASAFIASAGAPGFITQASVENPAASNLLPNAGISPTYSTLIADATTPIPTLGNDWPTVLNGSLARKQDSQLTNAVIDGTNYYGVNTMQPSYWPFFKSGPFLPPQTMPTIGDRLSAAGVSWKWYSGGWNQAVAGNPDATFQYHHQAFNFFKNYGPGKPGRTHLADTSDLANDIATGTLPAVSYVKFLGSNNEHPGYADVQTGQQAVADLVAKIQNSSAWKDTAIFITYDEYGGRYDHVAPPIIDQWGPGTRVPFIVISPYAKKHNVDHTQYESVSTLKFIEKRFGLTALGTRDAAANDLTNAFTGVPSTTN